MSTKLIYGQNCQDFIVDFMSRRENRILIEIKPSLSNKKMKNYNHRR